MKQKYYFSNTILTFRLDFSEDWVEYLSGTRKTALQKETFLCAAKIQIRDQSQ